MEIPPFRRSLTSTWQMVVWEIVLKYLPSRKECFLQTRQIKLPPQALQFKLIPQVLLLPLQFKLHQTVLLRPLPTTQQLQGATILFAMCYCCRWLVWPLHLLSDIKQNSCSTPSHFNTIKAKPCAVLTLLRNFLRRQPLWLCILCCFSRISFGFCDIFDNLRAMNIKDLGCLKQKISFERTQ